MTLLPSLWTGIAQLSAAFPWIALLGKATLLLAAAWLAHFGLARANPRWRALLWRGVAIGLTLILLWTLGLPYLEIPIRLPEPVAAIATPLPQPSMRPASTAPVAQPAIEPLADRPIPPPIERHPHISRPIKTPWSAIPWRAVLLGIWVLVALVLVVRLTIAHFRFVRLVRGTKSVPESVAAEAQRIAAALGCRRPTEIRSSARFAVPFLYGLRRPTVVLPEGMCEPSRRSELSGVLAHELTHVQSSDLAWSTFLQFLSILLWFHPLAWRVNSAHRWACDAVCDAVSASYLGNVQAYCRTLAQVALATATSSSVAALAMARPCDVLRRVAALERKVFSSPLRRRALAGVIVAGLATFALLAGVQLTPAQSAKSASVPKAGSLRAYVIDPQGKPIAGAELRAQQRGGTSNYTTDAKGQAIITVPRRDSGFLNLIVHADGYPPLRKIWRNDSGTDAIPSEFTFAFEQGRTIGGVVYDEAGKPIQGVKVYLSVSSDKYEQSNMCLALWDSPLLTDPQGRWHLDHVPERIDEISMRLEHPDYVNDLGHMVSPQEQQRIENGTAVMVMKKGVALAGTVTGPTGAPVAKALVAVGADRFMEGCASVRTDQKGYYRLGHLGPGDTVLTVVSPGLAPALRYVNVQSGMAPIDFRLEKGNTVRIRTIDKDNKPVQGVHISPDTWLGYRTLCDTGIAGTTDGQGRWTWSWAPKDAVEMSIYKSGYMSVQNLAVAPQGAEQVVTLYPPLRISGRVVDANTKQPIPTFHVMQGWIPRGSVDRVFWNRMPGEVLEGKNGQYTVTIDESSRAPQVRIEADGYEPGISRVFKADEGNVTCDFSLTRGRTLDVVVRLSDGKPAAGAEVRLCPETPGKFFNMATFVKNGRFPDRDMSTPTLTVGADGRLPIQPQDNKFLLIVVHDQGFAKTTSEELAAKPEITLTAWGRLEGVVRRGTKPVPNAKVDVYSAGSNGGVRWSFLNFQDQTEAGADGRFVFPKLKPGKWEVRLLPVDKRGRSPCEKTVEVGPGETVHVMLGGEGRPVVGRI